jgi:hypothetical protein
MLELVEADTESISQQIDADAENSDQGKPYMDTEVHGSRLHDVSSELDF